MAIRSLIFLGLFGICVAGALVHPLLGVMGYIAHYSIGPENQWWGARLNHLGIRYSYTLALMTAIGIVLNWGRIMGGRRLLRRQETLVLLFLGVVWLSVVIGQETVGRYTSAAIDHPSMKLTKVVIFGLMLTHVASRPKRLEAVIWVMILGALFLGHHAWEMPRGAFSRGRLEGVGGPDFSESNFLAAYMALMLWIIGVQFMRTGLVGKVVCFLAGGFVANAIVLTRSRGAVVGLAAGALAALLMAPKRYRLKMGVALLAAGIGFLWLADPQFLERTQTITRSQEQRDSSAQSRIRLAQAGLQMLQNHPLGVGAGNFYQNIGNYIPEYQGKDAHNTYVRVATELGVQGIGLFGLLILNGYLTLRRTAKEAEKLPEDQREPARLLCFGLTCALSTLLACCLTISLPYVEFMWWVLLLPVCAQRTIEWQLNREEEPDSMEAWSPASVGRPTLAHPDAGKPSPVPEMAGPR